MSTPPNTSEISEKNWCKKLEPFLTCHLRYEAMLKVSRKSWEPFKFRIYQVTITANPTQSYPIRDGLCKLAGRFSSWLPIINQSDIKNDFPFELQFFSIISDSLVGVCPDSTVVLGTSCLVSRNCRVSHQRVTKIFTYLINMMN